jgi:O-antigen/teichoic acid export membrane protein
LNEVKKLAGQTAVYGLGTILPRFLIYLILTPFYTYQFKTAEYGIITELYAWMVFFQIVLTYGMETGFFRFARDKENLERTYGTAFISLIITSVLFIALTFIFISPVAQFLNYPGNHDYIKMFAVILAVDAVCAIPFARLRNEGRPMTFSAIKILNVLVTVIVVVFLVKIAPEIYKSSTGWFNKVYNPDYRVGYVFVANLVGSSVTFLALIPVVTRVRPVFNFGLWKNMIVYSFPLLVAGLSGSINDAIDKVLLRRLIGEEAGLKTVGEYGGGYKVAVLMAIFIQMFRYAAEPFFFEKSGKSDSAKQYRDVMKYFVIVMLLIFMGINLYLPMIKVLLDTDYRVSLGVVPIVSMAYLLYGIYINHSIWYKINDLTRFGIYITLAGAAITVIVNLVFVPVYGYYASAWAHIASYLAMLILSFIMARKYYYVDYELKKLAPYFLIALMFVVLDLTFHFKNDFLRIFNNTLYIGVFLVFVQKREKLLEIFLKR